MTTVTRSGIIKPKADGFLPCPYCGRQKLLRIDQDTEATALPVYCRGCRREVKIDIHRGQSRLSRSPE
ncbi:MAG: cysteine-rich KTR domain-containing protein [Oscillospiraceae bacterium]|nr:cysteine-rich KTR domain-containing protein [Oscillospiraceae bacterium]